MNRMDTKDQGMGEQDHQTPHQDLLEDFTLLPPPQRGED